MRSLTLGVLSLVSATALFACGDDEGPANGTGGRANGGSSGSAGASGEGGSAGASGATNGGSNQGGGGSGNGGSGQTGESCEDAAEGGCIRIEVPAFATGSADFEVNFNTAIADMSNTTVTARVKAASGTAGAVQLYIKNGMPQNYAGYYAGYTMVSALADWTDITVNLTPCALPAGGADAGPPEGDAGDAGAGTVCGPEAGTFDKRAVQFIGVQVLGPTTADTVIYVDSIKFSVNPPADLTFATTAEGFAPNVGAPPPTGSTVTFLAP